MRSPVALGLLVFVLACGGETATEPESVDVPVLLDVEPDLILLEAPVSSVILHGEGFSETSVARIDGQSRSTAFVASDELQVTLEEADLEQPADLRVSVASEETGGILSGERTIRVRHANPVLLAVEPDTVVARSNVRALLHGDLFSSGMTLVLDDVHHIAVVRVSGDSIAHVDVPAGALSEIGTMKVRLVPEAPGVGPTYELELVVRGGGPSITSLFPASGAVGSAGMTLRIHGSGFDPASELRWNGLPRPITFVDSATLDVTLGPADLSAAGTGMVEVSGPDEGVGASVGFPIVPSSPTATSWTVGIPSTALQPDPVRDLVYATVPDGPHPYANHLVAIDVTTKTVAWSVEAGPYPISLAVTDDGAYAYVGLGLVTAIARIDLATGTRTLVIPIDLVVNGEPTIAVDLAALPGKPRSIAASLSGTVAVYDDAVMRPVTAPGSQRITSTSDPATLYGLDPQSASQHFRRYGIDADGVWEERVSPEYTFTLGGGPDLVYDGGLLVTNLGDVVDPDTFELLADFVWSECQVFTCLEQAAIPAPDVDNGRIHYWRGGQLIAKDATSFTELGVIPNVHAQNPHHMVRYGSNGVALGGGESILFVESDLIGPDPD